MRSTEKINIVNVVNEILECPKLKRNMLFVSGAKTFPEQPKSRRNDSIL